MHPLIFCQCKSVSVIHDAYPSGLFFAASHTITLYKTMYILLDVVYHLHSVSCVSLLAYSTFRSRLDDIWIGHYILPSFVWSQPDIFWKSQGALSPKFSYWLLISRFIETSAYLPTRIYNLSALDLYYNTAKRHINTTRTIRSYLYILLINNDLIKGFTRSRMDHPFWHLSRIMLWPCFHEMPTLSSV